MLAVLSVIHIAGRIPAAYAAVHTALRCTKSGGIPAEFAAVTIAGRLPEAHTVP